DEHVATSPAGAIHDGRRRQPFIGVVERGEDAPPDISLGLGLQVGGEARDAQPVPEGLAWGSGALEREPERRRIGAHLVAVRNGERLAVGEAVAPDLGGHGGKERTAAGPLGTRASVLALASGFRVVV